MDNGQVSISKSTTQNHDKGDETCSPFCSCNCCGQRVPGQKGVVLANPFVTVPEIKKASVQSFSLQNVLQHIWQPPQLV